MTTDNTAVIKRLEQECDRLRADLERIRQSQSACPHIITSGEGTSYCEGAAYQIEIRNLRAENAALRDAASRYLNHSDSGAYRDSSGLRPGASMAGEDLRALTEHDQGGDK